MITFEITYKDASIEEYKYPNEMKDTVRNFVKSLYAKGEITGWAITEIDGVSVWHSARSVRPLWITLWIKVYLMFT